MKKSTLNKNKYYLLGIIFIIALWCLFSFIFDESQMIFPSIFKVFEQTLDILGKSYTYKCILYSFIKLTVGIILSFILALVLGTISGLHNEFKYFIAPLITVVKSIPTASLVFLFLVIAGAKNAPIYIVILICFPILYESVVGGFENTDEDILLALDLEKGSTFKKIIEVKLPLAFPYILIGIASSIGLAFKIEIMAEVLTGATTNGLGSAIAYIQRNDPTNMVGIFSYSLLAVVLSLIIDLTCEKIANK